MTIITNPILPGFNADPSICRVGSDYYIAVSTFEWYPGVQIYHSTDLANWRLVRRPLDRASQLDMRGNPDSCGIWAPCLSFADGRFWLVYTDVKRYDGNFKDTHNYIITATTVEGPWSDPVYVNSSGFDPSLFHDDDGRKWFLNMQWNHVSSGVGGRPKTSSFAGILCQEWDPLKGLIGEAVNIFAGTDLGLVEGPHLLRRDGWYYLTTAEGGTAYNHAVTMARSRAILGPYELHPDLHPITSKDHPDAPLQRAGHGQIVETPEAEVYHTHLCSRPLPGTRRSPLGRETAIQKCVWGDDGWLRLEHGGPVPNLSVSGPRGAAPSPRDDFPIRRDFEGALPPEFQWLRTPHPDRIFSLEDRPGHLRLIARESIGSWFEQALVARRQQHFSFRAECDIDFKPMTFQQAAGITHYYNRHKFHFLAVTHDARLGRVLSIMTCPGDWPDARMQFPIEPIPLPGAAPVRLALDVDGAVLRCFYDAGEGWNLVGPDLDASVISDEGGRGEHGSFTGAFVGMAAFDTSGRAIEADFDWFSYVGRDV